MRSQAWGKICVVLLFGFAIVAVLSPEATNRLAHRVGVGRGADLLIYTLAIAFLGALLRYYIHRQADATKIVRLTRRLAILEANQNPHNTLSLKTAALGSVARGK